MCSSDLFSAAEVADLKIQLDKFLMNNDVVFRERREANKSN